ncbi:MAG: substrate-binding domain-containing protein [Chthoniobacterales bacterium]
MRKRPRIYVLLTYGSFDRYIHEGIFAYLAKHAPDMEIHLELDYPDNLPQVSKGIITRVVDAKDVPLLRSYDIPVVNISSLLESSGFPSVIMDNVLMGRLAAEHLLSRRFHHFAYYGKHSSHASLLHSRSFKQEIEDAGFQCSTLFHSWEFNAYRVDPFQKNELRKWITSLPKPIGIFCASSRYAWEISKICEGLDLTVGREVGILASGNDEFYCMTRHPPLSSIDNHPERIGYEAAALLLRLINGKPAPSAPTLIPCTLIARASSDVFVTDDPYVTMSIKFIRENIGQLITIQPVVDHLPLSRDSLERRFRKHLGYTILETIHLLKVDHLKHLLISTSNAMSDIANAVGFSTAPYMATLFREKVGMTPSEYRRRFQGNTITSKT